MDTIELQKLLSIMECLIDTVQDATSLENIYDNANEQSFSWVEVMESYQKLKTLAKVD